MAKILAISHDSHLYGAQRSFLDVVVGLVSAGHRVEVCVPQAGELTDMLAAHGIRVHVLYFIRWVAAASGSGRLGGLRFLLGFPGSLLRTCRLIRAGSFDVVYTNTVTVLDFAVAARLRRVPHVWHLRESAADNPQLRSPLSNASAVAMVRTLSMRVIYNSRHLLARYGGSSSNKDVVVHNGLHPRPAPKARPPDRDSGPVVVLTAGFMDQRKGLDVLLDAVSLLHPNVRARMVLRVAGHIEAGYMAREIAPRLVRLGAAVELLGWVDRLDEALAAADLLVSSARDEPFGRTLVEAMLAGVPVLATRSGGPQEIVVDDVTGLLVPPDDPPLLAAALASLVQEPQRLALLGHAGRERALTHFSLAACVRGVEQCLLQAIAAASPSSATHH